MSYHIQKLLLDEGFERFLVNNKESEASPVLSNLSKINIFVGANNSGKSRFLRRLSSLPSIHFVPRPKNPDTAPAWDGLQKHRKAFEEEFELNLRRFKADDVANLKDQLRRIPSLDRVREGVDSLGDLARVLDSIAAMKGPQPINHAGNFDSGRNEMLVRAIKDIAIPPRRHVSHFQKEYDSKYSFTKLYIPTLRGLRSLDTGTKDLYHEKTEQDYFGNLDKDTVTKPAIFTGLTLYREVRRLLLGDLTQREMIGKFQNFLSEEFFEGQSVALIPKEHNSVLDIKIGDEAERPVHHLGDGIQSLIILTFPLFTHSGDKLLVFCEEPELYLHPGLQRVLLAVMRRFPDYQYFFTTHSNHFLDLSLDFPDVSVFTVHKEFDNSEAKEKDAKVLIENISNENSRPLQLLGVRNSSVFLSNCTIWIEGITDRRYFRKYLNLYQDSLPLEAKRFQEDLHYSFVEYGGANITHWSFLDSTSDPINVERLCGRLCLIADSDNATGMKFERLKALEEKLGDRFIKLSCKEVENLIAPKILLEVVSCYEGEKAALQHLQHKDYVNEPLGAFIENRVMNGKLKRKYADGNTIRGKADFCEKAVSRMSEMQDLSSEAQEIAKRLYQFILKHNI